MDQDPAQTIVRAFAELLEAETGQGVDDWSRDQMEEVAQAFEAVGRPTAAQRLRKSWQLHNGDTKSQN